MTVFQETARLPRVLAVWPWKFNISAIFYLGFVLLGLQLLDGWLTYRGIQKFGLEIEGNPLVLSSMNNFGVVGGIVFAKGIASILLLGVLSLARKIPWIPYALSGVGGTYLFAAVIPWITLLNIAG